jgi:hypothetical protein
VLVSGRLVWFGSAAGWFRWLPFGHVRRCVVVGRGSVGWSAGRRVLPARLPVVLGLGVAWALVLGVGVAQAEPPKLLLYNTFSTGEMWDTGVTVDQSSGNVFVASVAHEGFTAVGQVEEFSAGGRLLTPPSPFAGGVDGGVAVDPAGGDVYVLEGPNLGTGESEIATYDPDTGKAAAKNFVVASSGNFGGIFTVVQIAADSAGDVYVPVIPQNEVLEYDPAACPASPAPCTPVKTFTGGVGAGALKGPTGVAVDSSGDVWVADNGDNRIEELSPADAVLAEFKSEGVESVALDGHGHVFAVVRNSADFCSEVYSPCQHLVEYSGAGVQITDVGAGSFGRLTGMIPNAVAVNESSGLIYVTDAFKERVWVFGPPTAPVVGKELTAEVTTSEAKLGALVSTGGLPTSYRFEYGTSSEYGQSTPFPEGSAGEGIASHTVWAAASGLAPGTTYHYRVAATNELGTSYGPDQTFTTLTAAQAACPNSAQRGGFSTRLPDCRAYELVTLPPKNSSQLRTAGPAAANGEAFGFYTVEPLSGSPTAGNYYLVTRGPGGWSEEDVMPLESYSGILCVSEGQFTPRYSSDMSEAVIAYGHQSSASQGNGTTSECNTEGLQVVQGEPVGYENLLVRDNATGTFRLVNAPPAGVTPADAHFQGASSDLSHVFFTEMARLTPEASYGIENLFEWDEGALRLLTVLRDGKPATGSLAGEPGTPASEQAISADGSHVLFTSGGGLYDRIDGERTVQIDEAQKGASGPSGGGLLQAASADGSTVLFLDSSRLTAGSTAQAGEPDLYECALPEGATSCQLTDLTVSAKPGEHADVLNVSGLGSKDSSHVYFVAKGALASNKREYEYTDTEGKSHRVVEEAKSGGKNLYVSQNGSVTFIATLDNVALQENASAGKGVVSPDGSWFAFGSEKSLTGYDNIESNGIAAHEIFLYDAATSQIECASCNPSGETPLAGGAELPSRASRPLSDGGRLFFETAEALVPSDTNGWLDVYEYEGGQASLISSGTGTDFMGNAGLFNLFVGASESGDDVFFAAAQQLVPQDTNEDAVVIYDARADGGFSATAAPPACTTADACRTPVSPQPSIYGAPSSQTFSGVGNLTPSAQAKAKKKSSQKKKPACRRGFVKKKGRCVKLHKKARKSNRHGGRR